MRDLDERLHGIDRLSPPDDLWEEAQTRAGSGADLPTQPSGWRRVALIAASLTIGLAAVAWVVIATRPTTSPPVIGDQPIPSTVTIPILEGLAADDARALLVDLGLVPQRAEQPSDDVAGGIVIASDPEAGVGVDPGSSVTLLISDGAVPPTRLAGLDAYRVCRLMVMPGDFGSTGSEVAVFEEELAPGGGCAQSEGFQHVAILRDGRVTALSRRITDALTDDVWRVWPYATPDLNADGIDEIAVALSYRPGDARRVWFFTLNADGSGIEGIYAPDAEPFTHLIGAGPDPSAVMPRGSYGIYCPMEGGEVVTWFAPEDDPSTVEWRSWRLDGFNVQLVHDSTMDASKFPDDSDPREVCGSPVSTRIFYPGQAPTT